MSFLSTMEVSLPPGFRFHPRDEELVCDYLAKKISGDDGNGSFNGFPTMMIDVDLNRCEPWDLPENAYVGGKEWYFFSLRDRKYATGQRTNRATLSGYWKATGKDRHVNNKGLLVGMRKTLVFYQGRAPRGKKTDWVMHEFRLESPGGGDSQKFYNLKEDWALCRVFYKSRGLSTKPSMDEKTISSSSSSLPPLMEETYITCGHSQGYEQVPCFSNPLMGPAYSVERAQPIKSPAQLHCDDKVVRAVLNQLTQLEGNQKREAPPCLEVESLESYYSCGNGVSPMW